MTLRRAMIHPSASPSVSAVMPYPSVPSARSGQRRAPARRRAGSVQRGTPQPDVDRPPLRRVGCRELQAVSASVPPDTGAAIVFRSSSTTGAPIPIPLSARATNEVSSRFASVTCKLFLADGPLQLGRRALRDDPAVVDHHDVRGELIGLFQVLGGEHHRGAAVDHLANQLPHADPAGRVESCGRLVEEDHRRCGHQGPRQVQPPTHSPE